MKRKRYFFIAMAVMLVLQLAVLCYYGNRKTGFHEDELYTYYSSNKTAGLFVNDRQWMDGEQLRNELVVLPGEGFRYDVVRQMQSWDVHPPLYYYLFHTACSLAPGVFSKWLGIGVNLIAYVGSYLLLAYCAYLASSQNSGRMLAFLTCLGWGFSCGVISGVMFIRMYQWLTLFILLCTALHLRAVVRQDFRIRSFLLPLALTVFLGFLTQYYYIIFHFFMGVGFCIYLLSKKKVKTLFAYGISCGAGLAAALVYYPAALSHIFRGYRGTEAVSEFGDASNTLDRLRFFCGLLDDYELNGTLSIWLLVIALLAVTVIYLNKRGKCSLGILKPQIVLLLFAAAGYFFVVSKTALLLGASSNRYQLPVYGIVIFLLLYLVWSCAERLAEAYGGLRKGDGIRIIFSGVLTISLLIINGTALDIVSAKKGLEESSKVLFLYEEEKETLDFAREHKDEAAVVFYNEASSDHIWWLSNQLIEYSRVYLAGLENSDPITDKTLTESDCLLVYMADYENQEERLKELMERNDHISSYQQVGEKILGLWTLYKLQ